MKTIVNKSTKATIFTITSEVTSTDLLEAVEKDGGTMSRTSAKELLYGRAEQACGYTVVDTEAVVETPAVQETATDTTQPVATTATEAPVVKVVKSSGRKQRIYVAGPKVAEVGTSNRLYVKLVAMIVAKPEGVSIDEMYAAFPEEKQNTIQNEIWRVKKSEVVTLVIKA